MSPVCVVCARGHLVVVSAGVSLEVLVPVLKDASDLGGRPNTNTGFPGAPQPSRRRDPHCRRTHRGRLRGGGGRSGAEGIEARAADKASAGARPAKG